jgi:LysR family glycine cleavage system transcriptional activator
MYRRIGARQKYPSRRPSKRRCKRRPHDKLQLENSCVLAGTFSRRAELAAQLAIAAKMSHFRDKLPTHRASQRPEALPRSELEIAMSEFHFPDRKLLPPIAALRAFDAAARLGSFTIAAEELRVTQGAVSRQIRLLEDLLQVTLFDRSHHRVVPTDAGRHYAKHVCAILSRLMAASNSTVAFSKSSHKLHIGIIPTMGSRWIIPKLPEFLSQHPDIELQIRAVNPEMSLDEEELDAALIVGRGIWKNTISHRLASEDLVPVASPRWLQRFEVKTPQDLIGAPLLTHTPRPDLWPRWFEKNGIDADVLVSSTLALEQITMLLEAALADLGAALLPRLLIRRELERRELITLPGDTFQASEGFFFVYAGHRESYPALAEFRDWLLSVFES